MSERNPALTAGPNSDGSKSLAKESKTGLLTSFATGVIALAVLGFAQDKVDVTSLPGWLQGAATYVLATVTGLAAAYVKKNR
jgi:Mg/Co/Ni transporter MgtE